MLLVANTRNHVVRTNTYWVCISSRNCALTVKRLLTLKAAKIIQSANTGRWGALAGHVTRWAPPLLSTSSSTGSARLPADVGPGWTTAAGRQSASGTMTGSCRPFDFSSALTGLLIVKLISETGELIKTESWQHHPQKWTGENLTPKIWICTLVWNYITYLDKMKTISNLLLIHQRNI